MEDARRSISDYMITQNGANANQHNTTIIAQNANSANQRNSIISPQQKRPRVAELSVPQIHVTNDPGTSDGDITPSPSMETIITRPTTTNNNNHQFANRNALLHDRLLDKIARYKSHNEFLRRCVTNKVIPFSYKLSVEPSIGNHDDTFLKGYYDLLDNFSSQLMSYTADYCAKKQTEFEQQKKTSEDELKGTTDSGTFNELQKTFEINQKKRQKTLQETKDKKFIRLKYRTQNQTRDQFYTQNNRNHDDNRPRPQPPPQNYMRSRGEEHTQNYRRTNRNDEDHNRRTYQNEDFTHRPPSRRTSHNNLNNHRSHSNNIENKIEYLERQLKEVRMQSYSQAVQNNIRKDRPQHGSVVNDKYTPHSQTRNQSVYVHDTPSSSRNTATSYKCPIDNTENHATPAARNNEPGHTAQIGENSRLEITEVLDYINTAMRTLGEFGTRLKQQNNIMTTPSGTSLI